MFQHLFSPFLFFSFLFFSFLFFSSFFIRHLEPQHHVAAFCATHDCALGDSLVTSYSGVQQY